MMCMQISPFRYYHADNNAVGPPTLPLYPGAETVGLAVAK